MSKLSNNPLNDLKGQLLKTKENDFDFDITEELKTNDDSITKSVQIKKETPKVQYKEETKKVKTYRLPLHLINDIDKIVYMDRELRGNETTLITRALENYVYSKEGKELIKQYDELKGEK